MLGFCPSAAPRQQHRSHPLLAIESQPMRMCFAPAPRVVGDRYVLRAQLKQVEGKRRPVERAGQESRHARGLAVVVQLRQIDQSRVGACRALERVRAWFSTEGVRCG